MINNEGVFRFKRSMRLICQFLSGAASIFSSGYPKSMLLVLATCQHLSVEVRLIPKFLFFG